MVEHEREERLQSDSGFSVCHRVVFCERLEALEVLSDGEWEDRLVQAEARERKLAPIKASRVDASRRVLHTPNNSLASILTGIWESLV